MGINSNYVLAENVLAYWYCIVMSAPRPIGHGACLETLATTIKGMDKDDLRLLESLVAARQRELMQGRVSV